jgi:hypothetical protein
MWAHVAGLSQERNCSEAAFSREKPDLAMAQVGLRARSRRFAWAANARTLCPYLDPGDGYETWSER